MPPSPKETAKFVEKIQATSLYQNYSKAFEVVTGLPLVLQPMHGEVSQESCSQSNFCSQVNANQTCRSCQCLHNRLMRDANDHVATQRCDMGLTESAVPVKFGDETIAVLRTGQVRHEAPKAADLKALAKQLRAQGIEGDQLRKLAEAYAKVAVIDEATYQETVTMLAIFSLHISTLINPVDLGTKQGGTTLSSLPQSATSASILMRNSPWKLSPRQSRSALSTSARCSNRQPV